MRVRGFQPPAFHDAEKTDWATKRIVVGKLGEIRLHSLFGFSTPLRKLIPKQDQMLIEI
jgi:hypothetical protein